MLDNNVGITVDENLKRSKALEEAGLLNNVTGKLSKGRNYTSSRSICRIAAPPRGNPRAVFLYAKKFPKKILFGILKVKEYKA